MSFKVKYQYTFHSGPLIYTESAVTLLYWIALSLSDLSKSLARTCELKSIQRLRVESSEA